MKNLEKDRIIKAIKIDYCSGKAVKYVYPEVLYFTVKESDDESELIYEISFSVKNPKEKNNDIK